MFYARFLDLDGEQKFYAEFETNQEVLDWQAKHSGRNGRRISSEWVSENRWIKLNRPSFVQQRENSDDPENVFQEYLLPQDATFEGPLPLDTTPTRESRLASYAEKKEKCERALKLVSVILDENEATQSNRDEFASMPLVQGVLSKLLAGHRDDAVSLVNQMDSLPYFTVANIVEILNELE